MEDGSCFCLFSLNEIFKMLYLAGILQISRMCYVAPMPPVTRNKLLLCDLELDNWHGLSSIQNILDI